MFVIVPKRFRKTKTIHIKENVPIKIEQNVAITLEFSGFYVYGETLIDGICYKVQDRYIPKRKYGFRLISIATGENCRPLRGEELYNNAIEQNGLGYNKCINDIIQMYEKETGLTKIDYNIEKYEDGFAKITYRAIEYDKEVEI
jgi:hypothetical protein